MKWLNTLWTFIVTKASDGVEKSTVGTVVMFGCFALITYLTISEGGTETVENLIITAMIVAATLMGVNSVTDIFKPKRCKRTKQEKKEIE